MERILELGVVVSKVSHLFLFIKLNDDRQSFLSAGACCLVGTASQDNNTAPERIPSIHTVGGNFIVDPDFTAFFVSGHNIGRAQNDRHIRGRHAFFDFSPELYRLLNWLHFHPGRHWWGDCNNRIIELHLIKMTHKNLLFIILLPIHKIHTFDIS